MPISAPPPSWASIKNKPNTVSGFGITDMGSQSVNYANSAGNGGVTSLNGQTGAVTNTALGSIGSTFLTWNVLAVAPGNTTAGSNLTYYNGSSVVSAGLSGTWRMLGSRQDAGGNVGTQMFVRIS